MAELSIIFGAIILILLVVLPMAYMFQKRSNEHEERKLELLARAEEAKSGTGGVAYRKLEERIRVLERIATDRGADLALEIEQLRDAPRIEGTPIGVTKEHAA
mgnify:CR=1 FL=1|tara:strand:- start:1001 stop:1309 length:309 start_codon:yes stop_codon:yes gene_type:complete